MKDINVYFRDMLDYGTEAISIAGEKGHDNIRKLAIERCFEVMGEAAKNIPRERQPEWPEIPWKTIIDLRNAISHEYETFKLKRLEDIALKDLPAILLAIESILKKHEA